MKYIVKIYYKRTYGCIMDTFESDSRDSLKHLKRTYGTLCKVLSKKGKVLSVSRYDVETGWQRCKIEER